MAACSFWQECLKTGLRFDKLVPGVKIEPWLKSGRVKVRSAVLGQGMWAPLDDYRLAINDSIDSINSIASYRCLASSETFSKIHAKNLPSKTQILLVRNLNQSI